jgi:glyoxylase-like metal-dependent hydrolase (beta-lactamase superfamily II)
MFLSARLVSSCPLARRAHTHVVTSATTKPKVDAFWHSPTFNWTYVVTDPTTNTCAIIDPVLDYDMNRFATSTKFADSIVSLIKDRGLQTVWIMVRSL